MIQRLTKCLPDSVYTTSTVSRFDIATIAVIL